MRLTIFPNTQINAAAQGRWARQVHMLNDLWPDVVGLSKADLLSDPEAIEDTKMRLGMALWVGPSRNRHRLPAEVFPAFVAAHGTCRAVHL